MLKRLVSWFLGKKEEKTQPKKDGHWKEFNKQGILISEGAYAGGLRNGLWKLYYETGELVIEETYINGKMHGAFKSYYKNGSLISEGQYLNNMREGKFLIFNQDGSPTKTMLFRQDVLVEENELTENKVLA